mmetsp:Transcript_14673/g.36490  ORF Transcript_14673/g.36490 Transcript_14673/m.36490 type:complete len:252 (+) Transcript_14673:751-1506(+)
MVVDCVRSCSSYDHAVVQAPAWLALKKESQHPSESGVKRPPLVVETTPDAGEKLLLAHHHELLHGDATDQRHLEIGTPIFNVVPLPVPRRHHRHNPLCYDHHCSQQDAPDEETKCQGKGLLLRLNIDDAPVYVCCGEGRKEHQRYLQAHRNLEDHIHLPWLHHGLSNNEAKSHHDGYLQLCIDIRRECLSHGNAQGEGKLGQLPTEGFGPHASHQEAISLPEGGALFRHLKRDLQHAVGDVGKETHTVNQN